MSTPDFSTAENNQELAQEVSCLKAMMTLMLQAMGQADAGRVIIKMEKQIVLTRESYDAKVKELEQLKTTGRDEIAERIKVARSFGDLSENSEYDEAMNEQAKLEAKSPALKTTSATRISSMRTI